MAEQSSNIGGLVKWGVLGLGAFWLWKVYSGGTAGFSLSDLINAAASNPAAPAPASSQTVPAAAAVAGQPAASSPASPVVPPNPAGGTSPASVVSSNPAASLAAELMAAAAGDAFLVNGAFNADHWAFYYNSIRTPLTPAQFGQAFP